MSDIRKDHIERLDQIIDNPKLHNTEERVNIVVRVLRDIAMQVRGHYNDIGLLKEMVGTIQKTIEALDSKLFGDRNSEGIIYALTAEVNSMKRSFDNFTRIMWLLIGAVVVDIALRFFNII
jgi:hypothetical protein